jgi:hypothetical protein
MVTEMIAKGELSVPDLLANQPIGRLGRTDEIAAATVLWLSCPAASLVGRRRPPCRRQIHRALTRLP